MTDYYVTTSGDDSNDGLTEGNAFASPGKGAATAGDGDTIYVKSGTYTLTTTTINANAGPPSLANGTVMEGYLSTIGDRGAYPVIDAGALTSFTMCINTNGTFDRVRPSFITMKVDGKSNSGVIGFDNSGNYARILDCQAVNCADTGIKSTVGTTESSF